MSLDGIRAKSGWKSSWRIMGHPAELWMFDFRRSGGHGWEMEATASNTNLNATRGG